MAKRTARQDYGKPAGAKAVNDDLIKNGSVPEEAVDLAVLKPQITSNGAIDRGTMSGKPLPDKRTVDEFRIFDYHVLRVPLLIVPSFRMRLSRAFLSVHRLILKRLHCRFLSDLFLAGVAFSKLLSPSDAFLTRGEKWDRLNEQSETAT